MSKSKSSAANKNNDSMTKIFANFDVGWGNTLYIRGEGDNLSWSKGIPMKNNGNNIWAWTSGAKKCTNFQYKLLINDVIWCNGENYTANAGKDNYIVPVFCN
ncbi:MAG: hypothetical protein LBH49_03725 [Puniceicoccales bacterium]|jgi:hypothetical protein|nr:hypothetical protein [Puniceicoccales bacterium]